MARFIFDIFTIRRPKRTKHHLLLVLVLVLRVVRLALIVVLLEELLFVAMTYQKGGSGISAHLQILFFLQVTVFQVHALHLTNN